MWKRIQRFFHDLRIELKKVNWPAKRELTVFTSVVIVVILSVGVFFWLLDSGFTEALKLIVK